MKENNKNDVQESHFETEVQVIEGKKQPEQQHERSLALPSQFSVPKAIKQWEDYQLLTEKLLDDTDYQITGSQKFKKKSAWRKYSRAFNLTEVEKRVEVPQRDDQAWPIYACAWSSVASPDSRVGTGYHECNLYEKCCPARDGLECKKNHEHCIPNCNGKKHWGHPGDIPATAHTRAKNRAISDWVGAGEVSAEEINESRSEKEEYPPCPNCGKKTIIKGKAEYGGGFVCWKNHPDKGCGTKFANLDELKNPKRNEIAKQVARIYEAEKKFKDLNTHQEYLEILGGFGYEKCEEIEKESDATKILDLLLKRYEQIIKEKEDVPA